MASALRSHQILSMTPAKHGAVVRSINTPLHKAVHARDHEKLAQLLVTPAFKDIKNALDRNGLAPLHMAVQAGDERLVDMLLGKGAMVDVFSVNGETPLFFAQSTSIARILLLNGASPAQAANSGITPLERAITEKNMPVVTEMLELALGKIPHSILQHAFHLAVSTHNFLLVQGKCSGMVSVGPCCGETSMLHTICSSPLFDGERRERIAQIFQKLLQHGSSRSFLNNSSAGFAPLHYAVKSPFREDIALLILSSPDCDVDAKTSAAYHGSTALLLLCQQSDAPITLVQALLDHGANPKIPNDDGETALTLASTKQLHSLLKQWCKQQEKKKKKQTSKVPKTPKRELLSRKRSRAERDDINEETEETEVVAPAPKKRRFLSRLFHWKS